MKNLLYTICFLFFSAGVFAQTTVRGIITDAATNEPLIGASIAVKGTSMGTISDIDGTYLLLVSRPGDIELVVSYTGYTNISKIVAAGTERTENFALVSNPSQLADVVVSANKRAETSQSVPLSISVLTPQLLRRTGAIEFRQYASGIPNLSFGTQGGGGAFNDGRTSNQISLRGITGPNTTAMYLDETPLPPNIDPRLIDVSRVEVLRGPQGTLYGSSTMGGAVKVVSNLPNTAQTEGSVNLSAAKVAEGDLDYGLNGVLNLPISKNKAALRLSGFYDFQTGVFDRVNGPQANILNTGTLDHLIDGTPATVATDNCTTCAPSPKENVDDKNSYGFSASLGFTPKKGISITPRIMRQNQKGDGYDFADLRPDNFDQVRSSGVDENFEDKWTHYSLTGSFAAGKGKVVSSTSYTDRHYAEQEDEGTFLSTLILGFPDAGADFWAGVINRTGDFSKFVQELRYQSELRGKLNFTAGLFYGNEKLVEASDSHKPGFITFLTAPPELEDFQWFDMDNDQRVKEFALFGELYFDLTDKLRLTGGLRYFNAKSDRTFRAIGAPFDYDEAKVDQNVDENGINPKVNLTYKIAPNRLVYATVSKGYRLGGLNFPLPAVWCADAIAELGGQPPVSYGSDYLWNYELGFKSVWANGKIVTNASVFYNDWQNLQQRRFFPDCGLGFISNVGSASSTGLELEVKAKAAKGLDLGMGLGLLNAKIKETGPGLDAEKDDRILFTPESTFNLNAQYTHELSNGNQFFVRGDLQNVGERYSVFNPEAAKERVLGAYTLANARVGYVFGKVEIALFCNNLTGEQANFGDVTSLAAETPGRPRYMTNRPRTVGLSGRYFF